jgi:hypothetical protein
MWRCCCNCGDPGVVCCNAVAVQFVHHRCPASLCDICYTAAFLQYDAALEQVLQAKMRTADEERQRTSTGGGNKRRPGNSGEDAAWWTKEVRGCAVWCCAVLCLIRIQRGAYPRA